MKRLKQILIRTFILILLCSNSLSEVRKISSKKVLVVDGDTIFLGNKKIRFSGIDAPESFYRGKQQICLNEFQKIYCGALSKKKLQEKINNQVVTCITEKKKDVFNRILAECFVNERESLSVYMVKNGYAFDYVKYSKKKYAEYEIFAKKNKLGLWKTKFEYPWVWRKKNR